MKQHLANNSDQIGSFRLFANSYSSLLYYFCQFTDMGWHQSDKNELFLNLIYLRRAVSVVCTHCHQSLLPIFPEINSFQPSAGPSSFSKAGLIRITKQHHGKFSQDGILALLWMDSSGASDRLDQTSLLKTQCSLEPWVSAFPDVTSWSSACVSPVGWTQDSASFSVSSVSKGSSCPVA